MSRIPAHCWTQTFRGNSKFPPFICWLIRKKVYLPLWHSVQSIVLSYGRTRKTAAFPDFRFLSSLAGYALFYNGYAAGMCFPWMGFRHLCKPNAYLRSLVSRLASSRHCWEFWRKRRLWTRCCHCTLLFLRCVSRSQGMSTFAPAFSSISARKSITKLRVYYRSFIVYKRHTLCYQ